MQETKIQEEIEFDKLEDVNFEIEKHAFSPKEMTCSNCKIKMKNAGINVNLANVVSISLNGFECSKCKKKYLGLEEARKIDNALIVSRILREDFKMERSLSYDGSNWTFRIPKEFTHNVTKKKVEIIPLGAKQFCVEIR